MRERKIDDVQTPIVVYRDNTQHLKIAPTIYENIEKHHTQNMNPLTRKREFYVFRDNFCFSIWVLFFYRSRLLLLCCFFVGVYFAFLYFSFSFSFCNRPLFLLYFLKNVNSAATAMYSTRQTIFARTKKN